MALTDMGISPQPVKKMPLRSVSAAQMRSIFIGSSLNSQFPAGPAR